MPVNPEAYHKIVDELKARNVKLVAVSKTKTVEDILELYQLGQRDFGENYVQELLDKQPRLPEDIRWHFIGHLQTNKVRQIMPFVTLIQSVDSLKLLKEINKQAAKNNGHIGCLLQVHIAREETKFGLDEEELKILLPKATEELKNVYIRGLMGMASFSDDVAIVKKEFERLKKIFDACSKTIPSFDTLSMGMSSDYQAAIEEGSNMVRIGSLLFGRREYKK